MSETTSQVTADKADNTYTEELIEQLKKSKKIHDQYAKAFKARYTTWDGTRMEDWKEKFRITIPPDLNPRTCLEINHKLNEFFHTVTNAKSAADARLIALKATYDDKFRTAFTNLVEEYKTTGQRLPAKDTLVQLAEYKISSLKDSLVHAEIEISLWKDILANITNARKLIENGTTNLGVEAKALNTERYINNLNRKGEQ